MKIGDRMQSVQVQDQNSAMDKNDNRKDVKQARTWICSVCGYEHVGVEPPKKCPRCGVEAMYFDPVG